MNNLTPSEQNRIEHLKTFLPSEFTLEDHIGTQPQVPRRLGKALEVSDGFYVFSREGLDRLLRIDGIDTTAQKTELVTSVVQFEKMKERLLWAYTNFGLFNFFLYNNPHESAQNFMTYIHSSRDLSRTLDIVENDVALERYPFKYGIAKGINIEHSRGWKR
ncbi:MAG: hypothetical protein ACOC32_03105 [Nanoarchaeota archaeon]